MNWEELIKRILSDIKDKNEKVFILFGPTGVGKTTGAIEIAKKIDAEIINCDMAQIYCRGKIGTGQIKVEEMSGVKHHLIGFIGEPILISVYQMRLYIEEKVDEILSINKKVLIVGGSSFCVYSLFFAPSNYYKNNKEKYSNELLKNQLLDDVSLGNLKKYNDYMIFLPKYNYKIIFFDFSVKDNFIKMELWRKIVKRRVDGFFNEGLIKEIIEMEEDWVDFLMKKKFIGYYEVILYLKKLAGYEKKSLEEIKELVFFSTCQYGKKQRTFLKKIKKDLSKYSIGYIDYYF